MQKYRLISKKGEGTFSEVLKAQSIKSGRYVPEEPVRFGLWLVFQNRVPSRDTALAFLV